jgi:Rieske Fe-S protein
VALHRRSLLRFVSAGVCSYVAGPACSSELAPKKDAGVDALTDVIDEPPVCPPSSCGTDESTLVLTFADHPELANVGGSALVEDPRYKDPTCFQDFVLVVAHANAGYVAVGGSCTHSCCTVSFSKAAQRFECPCHGSQFSVAGKLLLGPADTPLQSLAVCADDCAVYVQLK